MYKFIQIPFVPTTATECAKFLELCHDQDLDADKLRILPQLLLQISKTAPQPKFVIYPFVSRLVRNIEKWAPYQTTAERQQNHLAPQIEAILTLPSSWVEKHLAPIPQLITRGITGSSTRCSHICSIPHFLPHGLRLLVECALPLNPSSIPDFLAKLKIHAPSRDELSLLNGNNENIPINAQLRPRRCIQFWTDLAHYAANLHERRGKQVVSALTEIREKGRQCGASLQLQSAVIVRCEDELFEMICERTGYGVTAEEMFEEWVGV
ncbi:hypothetical protein HDV00_009024 [Rhizophlyctis rosea]|nr:hypothetical protein HDV00_009024 [Rhizophlyctis rosea]